MTSTLESLTPNLNFTWQELNVDDARRSVGGLPIELNDLHRHTDTSHITALYVPSIGLVISGDGVYNNTHLYLAECNEESANEWLQALDKIESLHPKAVIAGHGVLDPDSSPRHIEETRRYLRDFVGSVASTSTAIELYEMMISLHPARVNPGSLWAAAKASKPS